MTLPNILIVARKGVQEILASALARSNADTWADWGFSELAIEATERLRSEGKQCRALILDAQAEDSFYIAARSKQWGWQSQIIFVSKLDDLHLRIQAEIINSAGFFLLPEEASEAIKFVRYLCS